MQGHPGTPNDGDCVRNSSMTRRAESYARSNCDRENLGCNAAARRVQRAMDGAGLPFAPTTARKTSSRLNTLRAIWRNRRSGKRGGAFPVFVEPIHCKNAKRVGKNRGLCGLQLKPSQKAGRFTAGYPRAMARREYRRRTRFVSRIAGVAGQALSAARCATTANARLHLPIEVQVRVSPLR